MDKRILDLVNDFSAWKGDTYKLAMLVAALQKAIDADKLAELGYPELSESL